MQERVGVLAETLQKATTSLLASLGNDTETATLTEGNATLVVKRLHHLGRGSIEVELEDSGVEVAAPDSLLPVVFPSGAAAGGSIVALVVTAFDAGSAGDLGGIEDTAVGRLRTEVRAFVGIDLWRVTGDSEEHIHVSGVEPIVFVLPVNFSEGLRCVFWDEAAGSWSEQGVVTSPENVVGEPTICETTHLSFFAVIWQGYVMTFQCSQLSLMTIDAILQLISSDWPVAMGSLAFGFVMAMLLVTFCIATARDTMQSAAWSNEFFLVARNQGPPEEAPVVPTSSAVTLASSSTPTPQAPPPGRLARISASVAACCSSWLEIVKGSSSLRDAIDDVLSSWISYFSDIRTILEELYNALEVRGEDGALHTTFHILNFKVSSHLLVGTLRRMVGASLGISDDLVTFILDSKDLRDFLTEERAAPATGGLTSSLTRIADMNASLMARRTRHTRRQEAVARAYGDPVRGDSYRSLTTPSTPGDAAELGSQGQGATDMAPGSSSWAAWFPSIFFMCGPDAVRGRRPSLNSVGEVSFDSDDDDDESSSGEAFGYRMARTPQEIISDMKRVKFRAGSSGDLESQQGGSDRTLTRRKDRKVSMERAVQKVSSLVPNWVTYQASMGVLGRGTDWRVSLNKREAWLVLHHEISEGLQQQSNLFTRNKGLCRMICSVFMVQNPFVSSLLFSPLMSSKMRALFLAMDVLGTLALSVLFFQASGSIKGKASLVRSNQCSTGALVQSALAFRIGRLLAIATGSVIISGIPVSLIGSLHNRDFRLLEYEGSPAWNRQLRRWEIQDRVLWTLGSLYVLFCTFYIAVFLANVSAKDHREWTLGLVLAISQLCLIVPVVVSGTIPTLAWVALNINDWTGWFDRATLIRNAHERLHERSNIMLPIVNI